MAFVQSNSAASGANDRINIWMSFKAGDEKALRFLMQQNYLTMHNYGSKFSKNNEFIKDCIQDVFIGMWQYRQNLSVPDSPKAYLLTALRRKMFSSRPKELFLSLDNNSDDRESFLFESSPELAIIEDELLMVQRRVIAELLDQLSERQREIIYLKFYQNLDRAEIAKVMGISEQSVSNLLQRTLFSLKKAHHGHLSLLLQVFILFFC